MPNTNPARVLESADRAWVGRPGMAAIMYPVAKRVLDIVLAGIGLILMLPALAITAILIKLDSPGPVIFRQVRMGRGFRPFNVYKFRTMRVANEPSARLLTPAHDPRITRAGHVLRAMKFDELPQLFNVLVGDMSLVGPRPEVPRYVQRFATEYARILTVRPGVTDPATLKYCDEADLLAAAEDPEREYVERIMPDKLRLADDYIHRATLSVDIAILVKTVVESVWRNAVPWKNVVLRRRRPLVAMLHIALVMASNAAAFWLRFDRIPDVEIARMLRFLPWLVACRALWFFPFRMYEGLWRYTSVYDLRNIVAAIGFSSFSFYTIVRLMYGDLAYPRTVFVIDALLAVTAMGGIRLLHRVYDELASAGPGRRVVIFGAGDLGEIALRSLRKNHDVRVVGFVDDDLMKVGQRIHGVPVLGTRFHLPRIMDEQRPHEVFVAMSGSDPQRLRAVVRALEPYKVPIKTVPDLRNVHMAAVRDLTIEDLLGRPAVGLDPYRLERLIEGRRVLVTGAGGSIGSELARQIAALHPTKLILLDRYENGLYGLVTGLAAAPGVIVPRIGDVTDRQRVRELFSELTPEIVFHAAAHKHVPLMEENPGEAVKNNVLGTRTVADAAIEFGAARFVLISTDKAVNPASVMGATKRVAELLVQHRSRQGGTAFAVVRFGNVLCSNGSVVPLFLEQIKRGGPVTVTHPDIRRYFMLIGEAVQLVLHAAAIEDGQGTFVLDMGEQIKLLDLARDVVRLAGYVPEDEIPITFTGLRPGEKLWEEISADDEALEPSEMENILKVRTMTDPVPSALDAEIEQLTYDASAGDMAAVLAQLHKLVPTFRAEPDRRPTSPSSFQPKIVRPAFGNGITRN